MGINVLSLFDGISCGQVALERAGIKVDNYYSSEINKDAIQITQKNYPKTIQLGDINKIKLDTIPEIDLIIGGSPCQSFSTLGDHTGFNGESGLFYEFVRVLTKIKPKFFLFENINLKKEWREIITKELGVKPILINSSLVSGQDRKRLYWTNIPNIDLPNDKGINLLDILCHEHKTLIKLVPFVKKRLFNIEKKYGYIPKIFNPYNCSEIKNKSPCLTSQGDSQTKSSSIIRYDGRNYYMLNSLEWERLQTLKDNYTYIEGFSESKRKNVIGDGWTIEVIAHIFSSLSVQLYRTLKIRKNKRRFF